MFSPRSATRWPRIPASKVHLTCGRWSREGSYSPTRLADKYGSNVRMDDLLKQLAGGCKLADPRHPFADRCAAYFIELDFPQPPPDMPPSARAKLHVVSNG